LTCVGAGKFLGVRRILARSPPNLPEKFCVTFAQKFSTIKNPFWCDLQKRIHVFFCKRWAPFFEFKQRWAPFFQFKQRWAPFLPGFSGIFPGFQQIKTIGVRFQPLHPRLLHHCPWKTQFWPLPGKNPSSAHL